MPKKKPCRQCSVFLSFSLVLLAAGCNKDEPVTRYKVPKEQRQAQRLLGAIMPQKEKDRTWYFKFVGPEKEITAQQKQFKEFLHSVRFPDKGDQLISWSLPEGWRVKEGWRGKPGTEFRYETLAVGPDESSPEMIISHLGGQSGSLLANINRWRDQMKIPSIAEAELGKVTRVEQIE